MTAAGMLKIFFIISWLNPFAATTELEDSAAKFLQSLDADQLKRTHLEFNDQSREDWHFFPASMIFRKGVKIDELNVDQTQLFRRLLTLCLSKSGYDKTLKIIALENVLRELENNPVMRDPGRYHVAFYGEPAKDDRWAWSFEGHHISLNFTIVNNMVSMTPRFFGANPATIPSGPRKGERTLSREEDLALQLINSMTTEQRKTAIFQDWAFYEIVTATSTEVGKLSDVGIRLKDLSSAQQRILLDLISEYLSAMPPELAKKRSDQLMEEEFDEIQFGWAGATELGKPHYYRIQGSSFLVEFDNSQNNANHIHSVWRDFEGDFGRDLLREHYMRDHQH